MPHCKPHIVISHLVADELVGSLGNPEKFRVADLFKKLNPHENQKVAPSAYQIRLIEPRALKAPQLAVVFDFVHETVFIGMPGEVVLPKVSGTP